MLYTKIDLNKISVYKAQKELRFIEQLYATTLICKLKTNANFSNFKKYLKQYYDQLDLYKWKEGKKYQIGLPGQEIKVKFFLIIF